MGGQKGERLGIPLRKDLSVSASLSLCGSRRGRRRSWFLSWLGNLTLGLSLGYNLYLAAMSEANRKKVYV